MSASSSAQEQLQGVAESVLNFISETSGNVKLKLICVDIWKILDHIGLFIRNGSVIITILVDIVKVDGGNSVAGSSLHHAASQAPVLGVRAELQDLVIVVMVTILATWI